jgi:hypothetical protein
VVANDREGVYYEVVGESRIGAKAIGNHLKLRGCAGLTLLVVLFCCFDSGAVVVELESGRRVSGWLVGEDAAEIRISTVDVNAASGEAGTGVTVGTVRRLKRDEIVRVIETVDSARLEALSPADPEGYRDYAEELSAMRADVEARVIAERLFVIAADLAPRELGGAAMLGAGDLVLEIDKKKAAGYRAMAYLMDPSLGHVLVEGGAFEDSGEKVVVENRSQVVLWQRFKEALRLFRQGEYQRALDIGRDPSVRPMFGRVNGLLSYGVFERICLDWIRDGGAQGLGVDLPQDQLRLMLLVEMSNRPGGLAPAMNKKAVGGEGDWSDVIARSGGTPRRVMDLRSLSGLDPKRNTYRGGRWVESP